MLSLRQVCSHLMYVVFFFAAASQLDAEVAC
jgi:hypothetical protein